MEQYNFDEITDVIVVGYGFAGAVAAIAAADGGASVTIVEKAPDPGGLSICSQGAICCTKEPNKAFAYLQENSAGRGSEKVNRALAEGMSWAEQYIRDLSKIADAEISTRPRGGNYQFAHRENFYYTHIDHIPNFDPYAFYPQVKGRVGGPYLFRVLQMNIEQRGIKTMLASPAKRLIYTPEREAIGVIVDTPKGPRRIGARRGVVLASGGFENSPEMKNEYWELGTVLPAANRTNTGDGIRMAQELGADLWHMWHFHGSYGFRHPDPSYPYGIRVKRFPDWVPGSGDGPLIGADMVNVPVAWILVDQSGKRFVNEQHPYMQDTGARPFESFDPITQSFPSVPCWLICDEEGRKLYPLGNPAYNDRDVSFEWSKDNLKEVELGILKKADTIDELATILNLPADTLNKTIERWNALTAARSDEDFSRPPGSMIPIATPPYYAGEIWPIVSNTQGGPRHDEKQRIINVFDEPVARLYAAGDMGSCFSHLYLAGGNIAECIITGRIAGEQVATEQPFAAQ